MPLKRDDIAVTTDNDEHGRIRVIAELLHEPEMRVENHRSRDVADIQHRLDAFDRRHGVIIAQGIPVNEALPTWRRLRSAGPPGERANARLKSWQVLRKIRSCPR